MVQCPYTTVMRPLTLTLAVLFVPLIVGVGCGGGDEAAKTVVVTETEAAPPPPPGTSVATATQPGTPPSKPVLPDVAGERLNVAQDSLEEKHIAYDVIGGGAFGVVDE